LIRTLRRGEYAAYLIVLGLTAVLLGLSVYLAGYRLYELATTAASSPAALSQAIYNALSDVFLVVIFVELIDTFSVLKDGEVYTVDGGRGVVLAGAVAAKAEYRRPISRTLNT